MAINVSIKKLLVKACILFSVALPNLSAFASGGDGYGESDFTPENHVTTADIADFASGKIGVVPNSYWRVYQFLAYRAVTGQPVSPADVTGFNLNGGFKVATTNTPEQLSEKGLSDWLAARKTIKGIVDLPKESRIRVYGNAGNYSSYYACPAHAFQTATLALAARLKTGEANAKIWLAGQDAVFENCSPPIPWIEQKTENDPRISVVLPPALPKNAAKWLSDDHKYQTAAAYFYAEKYDDARLGFQAIANNKASPWQYLGSYLAARCLIRKATLYYKPVDGSMDSEQAKVITKKGNALLTQAKAELAIASKTYPPAKPLLTYVDAQLRPYARLQELGTILATGKVDTQQLTDYLLLMDKLESQIIDATDPMTAWIGLMQAPLDGNTNFSEPKKIDDDRLKAVTISRKKWQKDQNPVWLAPLVSHAKANELTHSERKAIASIANNLPAYETLQYHLARIAIAENKKNDADEIVTKVLANNSANMSRATHNRWLALKVVTAKTEAEFLQALPRQLAEVRTAGAIPNEKTGTNEKTSPDETASQKANIEATNSLFDADFSNRIYHDFSVKDLSLFLANKDFPVKSLSPSLKETIWTRAIIFGDYATADALTDDLMIGRDTTKGLFERYKNAQTPQEKKLAAVLIMVNAPEFNPAIVEDSGSIRAWGCGYGNATGTDSGYDQPLAGVGNSLNFMKKEAIDAAQKERAQLLALLLRSEYLAPTLLAWVKQKPKDLEAPKALHFFVASTRMECPYGNIHPLAKTSYSKEAFELLHRIYPKSDWATKTKYYFKSEPKSE